LKLAYLILAHTNAKQLRRLAERLQNVNTWVFIHLDHKTPYTKDFSTIGEEVPNASFISSRVNIRWGAYSIVQAILNALQEIVNTGIGFDYINLMSGFDYPIKDNAYIYNFLMTNSRHEFIHHRQLPVDEFPEGRMDRIWYYYDYDNKHSEFGSPGSHAYEIEMRRRDIKRRFIQGLQPYHGSMWWCLTGSCVEYILNTVRSNREITNFFRYTAFPDEQFFQTMVMNSPFAQNAPGGNLWYLDWREPNAFHPKTLNIRDFPALKDSSALYARKLNENTDPRLLDIIDRQLLKHRSPNTFAHYFLISTPVCNHKRQQNSKPPESVE
jgi:hypothetical protein